MNATVLQLKLQHGDRVYADHSVTESQVEAPVESMTKTQTSIGKTLSGTVIREERPSTAAPQEK